MGRTAHIGSTPKRLFVIVDELGHFFGRRSSLPRRKRAAAFRISLRAGAPCSPFRAPSGAHVGRGEAGAPAFVDLALLTHFLKVSGVMPNLVATEVMASIAECTRPGARTPGAPPLRIPVDTRLSSPNPLKGWSLQKPGAVQYIEAAAAANLVTGTGGGYFDPFGTLTREQAAAVIARWIARTDGYTLHLLCRPEITALLGGFGDGRESTSLQQEVTFAIDWQIMLGTADNYLRPHAACGASRVRLS